MKKLLLLCITLLSMFATVSAEAMPLFEAKGTVAVITYHKVSENPAEWSDYCISPVKFEEDLKVMKSKGYEFMTATEVAAANISGNKIAVLTFDDGYKSDLVYVAPLLEKYGAKATFFVFGAAINTPDYMTEADLLELSKKPFVEIGNHSMELHKKTYNEILFLYRDGTNDAWIINDFNTNAEYIQKITGKYPTALSYPNGLYSKSVNAAFSEKYKITVSTEEIPWRGILKEYPVGRQNRAYTRDINEMLR